MTCYIFRLATRDDRPSIRRLQARLATETNDPLGIDEVARQHGHYFLVEVAGTEQPGVVGMMSMLRASAAPFVFERIFPGVSDDWALLASTGTLDIQRSDLVELDWGYIENPYRGYGFTLLLLAASILHAYHQGYLACVGIASEAMLRRMPPGSFRATGFVIHMAGTAYALGTMRPAELAPIMAEIVRAAQERDPRIVWQFPFGATAKPLYRAS